MDDCRQTADRLTPYVDETLPPAERRDVERHLDRCPPCRRSAEEEQGGRTLLRECADRLRPPTLPPLNPDWAVLGGGTTRSPA